MDREDAMHILEQIFFEYGSFETEFTQDGDTGKIYHITGKNVLYEQVIFDPKTERDKKLIQ